VFAHRDADAALGGDLAGAVVARVDVPDHARARVVGQDALQLARGATVIADGGGLASAALCPIEGAGQIARYVVDLAGRPPSNVTFLEQTVNGQPGLVAQQDGVTVTVYAFEFADDRITHMWAIRNPDKLRPWTAY